MLANPIASDLSVMRVSLWPGLLRAALENQRRQAERVRLFEHGTRFEVAHRQLSARNRFPGCGIACGRRGRSSSGASPRIGAAQSVDFYDMKSRRRGAAWRRPALRAASLRLRPRRCTRRCIRGAAPACCSREQPVGWIGELHPQLTKSMDFTYTPVLFELDVAGLAVRPAQYREISRFPQVRRDLAVVLDESVTLSTLAERVTLSATSLLRELRVFDVYRGPGLEQGRKSVALGLIFQDISRTLTDDDVERLMASVVADLRENLNARIRE